MVLVAAAAGQRNSQVLATGIRTPDTGHRRAIDTARETTITPDWRWPYSKIQITCVSGFNHCRDSSLAGRSAAIGNRARVLQSGRAGIHDSRELNNGRTGSAFSCLSRVRRPVRAAVRAAAPRPVCGVR